MQQSLGTMKTVQKSCRFTPEEVEFIQSNFGNYYNDSFNFCLSNMINEYYQNKTGIEQAIKESKKKLEDIRLQIAEYESVLMDLKRIKNGVSHALHCVKDLDKKTQ